MRVAILTTGRFHVCDLARELDALGHDVSFYSCLPSWRTEEFGLPRRCSYSLWAWLAPLFLLSRRLQGTALQNRADLYLVSALDWIASHVVKECDVLIGMSGMSQRTALTVRRKYGARVWIERGSRHILSQKRILDELLARGAKVNPVSEFAVRRELADYAVADVVVVPSMHTEQSFLEQDFPVSRLFRNPYGVDLEAFACTPTPPSDPPTLIMAGGWSLRKGCDLLTEACRRLPGVRLIHVGSILDAPVPNEPMFEHVETVPQQQLRHQYGRAHVSVLASREDGLGLVLPQALACGLSIVCSDRTGGEDLISYVNNASAISVVPHDDVNALVTAIRSQLNSLPLPGTGRDLLGESREKLSWREYGKRYARELAYRVQNRADSRANGLPTS